MDDIGRDLDKTTSTAPAIPSASEAKPADEPSDTTEARKRKGESLDNTGRDRRFNGRRRGSGGSGEHKRHKRGDMGRAEYFRANVDKRARNEAAGQRRREDGTATSYGISYTKDEIEAEERRPKRKVAVMIGYSGTGYKGMQISPSERTIEGDLFQAFVKAGAISKANADDPKKASLVRCARTDKGVHAAGNMISLKLIVEDEDIVQKINAELSEQIRVWGIERTLGGFSCYQACDSRWYEYLIPSSAFLPPHPSSYLAKQLERLADEVGDREGYESRQEEVKGFWKDVDERDIKPILDSIDEDLRWEVVKALQGEEEASAKAVKTDVDMGPTVKLGKGSARTPDEGEELEDDTQEERTEERTEEAAIVITAEAKDGDGGHAVDGVTDGCDPADGSKKPDLTPEEARLLRLRAATKKLRQAYNAAKRRYRIPKQRIERVQAALNKYIGTKNYHNYTILKSYRDPSAKRNIKSFVINPEPILTGKDDSADKTEWLSLKVHGQSFMMHQIRKMISMVSLLVRCGSDLATMDHSFTEARYSIPKVPGLGLMLERPVFDSYNNVQAVKHGREPLLFSKFDKEIEEFKHREIYARMFREEEAKGEFGRFFNQVDNFHEPYFLYVSSKGLAATEGAGRKEGYAESKV